MTINLPFINLFKKLHSMKKVTFLFVAVSLLFSMNLLADEPNVIMQREMGGELTLAIGLATAGNIQVDWGNGVLVTGAAGTTNTTANITGTVTGTNTIKLYGAITTLQVTNSGSTTLITSANVSNAPALVKFVLPRNKLTALDLSHNPLVRTISIYNNLLDACAMDDFFRSLPTITGSSSINMYNNPCGLTSTISIATAKGWTIGSGTTGDGTGCSSSAVHNPTLNNNMMLFYANQELSFSNTNHTGKVEMQILSVNGKKVVQKTIDLNSNDKTRVNIGQLTPGMYFANFIGSDKNTFGKFIVR